MKRRLVVGGIAVALGGLILAGPRAEFDASLRPIDLPAAADLDAHLAAAEAALGDVTPGAEKRIVWAGAPGERTERVVLYLHGFSATHRDTAPLAERVAEALGANLYLARLRGHGRGGAALGEATAADWLHDAREAAAIGRRLGDRAIWIGHSTGSTLAAWMVANGESPEAEAAVLCAPNFGPANPLAALLLWPFGGWLAEAIEGAEREWEPVNPRQARYFTTRYPTKVLLPMMATVDRTRRLPLEAQATPLLVFRGNADTVVSNEEIARAFARWGAGAAVPPRKEMIDLDTPGNRDGHVIVGDMLSPGTTDQVVAAVIAFVREIAP